MPWSSELEYFYVNIPLTHNLNSIIFVGDPVGQSNQDWEDSFGLSEWFEDAFANQSPDVRSLHYRYHDQNSGESSLGLINHAAHRLLSWWAKIGTQSCAWQLTEPVENARGQRNGPSRPVIFVCQSLGGSVVEQV